MGDYDNQSRREHRSIEDINLLTILYEKFPGIVTFSTVD